MAVQSRIGRRAALLAAALFLPLEGRAATLGERLQVCATCHGADGTSLRANVPSIAGQPRLFLEHQLILFREGLRQSKEMTPQAETLTDPEIEAIAQHYARLEPRIGAAPTDRALYERGRSLAKAGRCGTCHLPDFSGRQQMPRLAGQREDYLAQTLRGYRDQTRGGADTTMNDIMREAADGDIDALAHFLSRQVRGGG